MTTTKIIKVRGINIPITRAPERDNANGEAWLGHVWTITPNGCLDGSRIEVPILVRHRAGFLTVSCSYGDGGYLAGANGANLIEVDAAARVSFGLEARDLSEYQPCYL